MSDTTTRLRADLVVGGLWEGAPVWVDWAWPDPADRWECEGVWHGASVVWSDDGRTRVTSPHGAAVAYLRLDDPLGLGLALLAARVARRLAEYDRSLPDPAADGLDAFEDHIEGLAWYPFMAAGRIYGHGRYITEIASTYLALTDRLCAAVGLTLAPGEVAKWEGFDGIANDGTGASGWVLRVESSGGMRWFGGPDDWRGALEAAIAEVTR